MKSVSHIAALFCLGFSFLWAQGTTVSAQVSVKSSAQRVGPEVVWNPSPGTLSAIREKCAQGAPASIDECFLAAMESAGASPQAVAFARASSAKVLYYVRAFRKAGPVDLAYIEYPFRANELEGVLLVNGEPSIIDVDSERFLSTDNFSKDPNFAALAAKYPQISIWPGDRHHTNKPSAERLASGEQLFEVDYILRDGCHACAQIGAASLTFRFDQLGRFSGAQPRAIGSP